MNLKTIAFTFAVLPLAMACSSTAFTPTSNEMNTALTEISGQDGRACFRVRDISGFGTLNDTTVSVSDKFRGHYLLVTSHRCPELETSTRAAFKGAFTEFCGRRDALFSRGGRCPVRSVFTFENRQAAFDAYDRAKSQIRQQREANTPP